MNPPRFACALLGVALSSAQAAAQTPVSAQVDTVVLIVKSPHGQEVAFSGTIVFRDARTARRFDNVMTPFEIRLPRQNIDASFTADDGLALNGEIFTFKDGKQRGHIHGTMYGGPVLLYFDSGGRYGFGSKGNAPRVVP